MTELGRLREEFVRGMKLGIWAERALRGVESDSPSIDLEKAIRPFYFIKNTKNGPQPSNADGQCSIAARLGSIMDVPTWESLEGHVDPRVRGLLVANNRTPHKGPFKGQTCGTQMELLVKWFLEKSIARIFPVFSRACFQVSRGEALRDFVQYRHLRELAAEFEAITDLPRRNRLRAMFSSYEVKADILIERQQLSRAEINSRWSAAGEPGSLISDAEAKLSPFVMENGQSRLLHAVISSKWTLRSDRAQNARTEAANASRERRGQSPHVVVVTGEPKPSRIRSIALGPDVDCVYHVSLPELEQAIDDAGDVYPKEGDSSELEKYPGRRPARKRRLTERDWFKVLRDMNRLRDITDLPLDLAT